MFRILGFILGSAVSIAGIFMVLGVPEINLHNAEADQARFEAALEKNREKQPDGKEYPESPDEIIAPTEVTANPGINEIDSSPPADATLPVVAKSIDESFAEPLTAPQDVYNPQLRWHEFWNPFRSELAARGFVTQLEKVTSLDYRVLKIKAGVYQVGFAYVDDEERRIKISQISAATGLDLPQT